MAQILLLPVIAFLAVLVPQPASAATVITPQTPQFPSQGTLFTAGETIGSMTYSCFRIPSVVSTATGTLLAFAEARNTPNCADNGEVDIVSRRSTDGGGTWGPRALARSSRSCVVAGRQVCDRTS